MDGTGMPEGLTFLGLDYSQSDFYVDNEGRKANYPKYYRQSEERLTRLQKSLARKEKDSLTYKKVLGQIQKLLKKHLFYSSKLENFTVLGLINI